MKAWNFYLALMSLILLVALISCTPPPDKVGQTPGSADDTQVAEEDTSATDETETPADLTDNGDPEMQESVGKMDEVTADAVEDELPADEGEPVEEEPAEEEPAEEEPEPVETAELTIDNIFTNYENWPPESITPDEVDFLRDLVIVMETTKGTIKLKVFPDAAPIHSANFVKLVRDGFYNGSVFHRVLYDFMSQAGMAADGSEVDYRLPAEIGLPHRAGTLAAARQADQVNPHRMSSGCQFYLVHTDTSGQHLNGQYSAFGQIIEGLDVNLELTITGRGEADVITRAYIETE